MYLLDKYLINSDVNIIQGGQLPSPALHSVRPWLYYSVIDAQSLDKICRLSKNHLAFVFCNKANIPMKELENLDI